MIGGDKISWFGCVIRREDLEAVRVKGNENEQYKQ